MWDRLCQENGDKGNIKLQLVVVHVSMWGWICPEQLGHQCCSAWVSTLPGAHTAPKHVAGPKSTKCCQEFALQPLCVPGTVRSEKQLMSHISWSRGVCLVCLNHWLCFLCDRWTLRVSLCWPGTLWLCRTR